MAQNIPTNVRLETAINVENDLIFGEDHRRNTRNDLGLDCEPTNQQLLEHWFACGAHNRVNKEMWQTA